MVPWNRCAFLVSEELIVKLPYFAVFLTLLKCRQLVRKKYWSRTLKGEVRVFFFCCMSANYYYYYYFKKPFLRLWKPLSNELFLELVC